MYESSSFPKGELVHVCIGFSRVFNNKILTFQKQANGNTITEDDIEGWLEGYPKYGNGHDYVYAMFDNKNQKNSGMVFNDPSSECYFQCEI